MRNPHGFSSRTRLTIKHLQALALVFAISAAPIFTCKAQTQTVFLDFTTNDIIGENIIGQTPDIGLGNLDGDSGGTLQITTNYSVNTVGAARLVFGAFTSALGPGQVLTLSYNLLDFGPAFPNSGGYAGVSLYTGYSSYSGNAAGNEEEFTGEPYNANQWGVDGATTGNVDSGSTRTPVFATFTYAYDTGAWTFTTTGGVNLSGTGAPNQPFNAIRIANGSGADIELNNLRVQISPAGAPVITEQPTPADQTAYAGQSASVSVQVTGNSPLTNTWLVEKNGVFVPLQNGVDANGSVVSGASTTTLIISDLSLLDGTNYEFIVSNALGSATNLISAMLIVSNGPAYVVANPVPSSAQAYSGAAVTYAVTAQGNQPIMYQWSVNGTAVNGATNSTFTLLAGCGISQIQVAVSNAYNSVSVLSDVAMLEATNTVPVITFNDGAGWSLNGNDVPNVPIFTDTNDVELTDCGGSEASSVFYSTAQYVGNGFTASFVYQAGCSQGADGTAFILQNSLAGPNALGAPGGGLGYGGITNSIALELNLYTGGGENLGMTILTNGLTGAGGHNGNYDSTGNVFLNSGDPISVVVNYANGLFAVQLEDLDTLDTFSTNVTIGPITPILGSELAYVGFSGGDGGLTSSQTVSNFQFSPVVAPVALTISPGSNGSVVLAWPAANPNYTLQTTTNLLGAWSAGPAATISGGSASVTIHSPSGTQFYRLVLGCQ